MTEAYVLCYPTEVYVAHMVATVLGIPWRVSESVPALGLFYIVDPRHELDPVTVQEITQVFARPTI